MKPMQGAQRQVARNVHPDRNTGRTAFRTTSGRRSSDTRGKNVMNLASDMQQGFENAIPAQAPELDLASYLLSRSSFDLSDASDAFEVQADDAFVASLVSRTMEAPRFSI